MVKIMDNPYEQMDDLGGGGVPYFWVDTHMQMSHEKKPGWLGYIGDYTTQLHRDYNEPL